MEIIDMTTPRPGEVVTVTVDEDLGTVITAEYRYGVSETKSVGTCTRIDARNFSFVQPVDGVPLGFPSFFQAQHDGTNIPEISIRCHPPAGFTEVTLVSDFDQLDPKSSLSEAGVSGLGQRDQIIHTAFDPSGNPISIDQTTGLLNTTYAGELEVEYYIQDYSDGYARGLADTLIFESNLAAASVANVNGGSAITDGQTSIPFDWEGIIDPTHVVWVGSDGAESDQIPVSLTGDSGSGTVNAPNIKDAIGDYNAPSFGDVYLRVVGASESATSTTAITYSPASGYTLDMDTDTVNVTANTLTGSTATEGNISFGRAGGAYPNGTEVLWPTAGAARMIYNDGEVKNSASFVLFARPPSTSLWERIEWNQITTPVLDDPAAITVASGEAFSIDFNVTAGDYDIASVTPSSLSLNDNGLGMITVSGSLTATQNVTVTVTNTDTGASDNSAVAVNISGSQPLPQITATGSISATEEQSFAYDFAVDNLDLSGTDTLTASLPSATGLTAAHLSGNSYRVSGTAPSYETTSSDTLEITAANDVGPATVNVPFNVVDIPEPTGPATHSVDSGESFSLTYTLNGPYDSVSFSNTGFTVGAVSSGQCTVTGSLDHANGASQTLIFTVTRGGINYTVNTVVSVAEQTYPSVIFALSNRGAVSNADNFAVNAGQTRASETFDLVLQSPTDRQTVAITSVSTNASGILADITLSTEFHPDLSPGVNYYAFLYDSNGYVLPFRFDGVAA